MKKISIIASALVLLSAILNADITIKNGWQLLGATQDINASIFNDTCVDYVWKYDATNINNTQWQVHIANEVAYNNTMAPITSLVKGEGYWVKGNADCNITLAEVRFTRSDQEVVTDHKTSLQWQDDAVAASTSLTYDAALTHCSDLTLDGGGWRLPSIYELTEIVEGSTAPTISPVFVSTASNYYWSSTAHPSLASYAWGVYFYNGYSSYYTKTDGYYVRCVRAGQ